MPWKPPDKTISNEEFILNPFHYAIFEWNGIAKVRVRTSGHNNLSYRFEERKNQKNVFTLTSSKKFDPLPEIDLSEREREQVGYKLTSRQN